MKLLSAVSRGRMGVAAADQAGLQHNSALVPLLTVLLPPEAGVDTSEILLNPLRVAAIVFKANQVSTAATYGSLTAHV